ncbi:DUF3866 family protein [Schnuerera sp. xch1]|uniref:DUF3866 family protein n=1 Tax=Schnuerera sp. xch1 TaxID=2874283 RepID=UPI001CBC3232|nr:DUF3866 family protein [Schnuerera sp. xch1]MBZ2173768.1 DUF3866 family protein [Schnuerera sp. xch1]
MVNLLSYRKARVVEIEKEEQNISWVKVETDKNISKAINYNDITGTINVDDVVIVNTTAVELSLGTGGFHFVIHNYSNEYKKLEGKGHIMKLRYTPLQIKCLAAEEEDSKYFQFFKNFTSLDNHICIIGTLHSMLAPIVSSLKWFDKNINVNYIMTDGGSLPLHFSNTVRTLKEKKLLNNTISIGHAFGGDLECTNIYTGLIAAKEILKGNVTVITMGPGIVGTGTKYGFSGIEQGQIVDAVNTLGGNPIIVPRISFKDPRERHIGISHHTRTVLSEIAQTAGKVIIPTLEEDKLNIIKKQIQKLKIHKKHQIIYEKGDNIIDAMNHFNLKVTTMGRNYEKDKEFFLTLGAVGSYVIKELNRGGIY